MSSVSGPDGGLRYHVLVVSDITEQRLQRERLERQAHFDELTRLPNRAHLGPIARRRHAHRRDRRALARGVLLRPRSLPRMSTNDTVEKPGTACLPNWPSACVPRCVPVAPCAPTWLARLGGDEFVLLMHASSVEEVRARSDACCAWWRSRLMPPQWRPGGGDGQHRRDHLPVDGSDADTCCAMPTTRCSRPKQSAATAISSSMPSIAASPKERALAIGRVQEALDQHELVLYYQPKVDLRRGVVLGLEALLRWNHPEHGVVAPAQFLPLIEAHRVGPASATMCLHRPSINCIGGAQRPRPRGQRQRLGPPPARA